MSRRSITLLLITLLAAVATGGPVHAAATRSQCTMLINERGTVEVVDRWSGMVQADGVYDYFSAAREIGIIPVRVKDHGFTINFATRSYLRYEDGEYYFVTPDFYYADGPLDVELALTYPPNLVLVESRPEPDYSGEGVLQWSFQDAQHQVVMVRFERVGPFVQPGRSGPDWQVDPGNLAQLSAEELPLSADDVLKELESIIAMAKASQSSDPDFLRVMDKLLAKFYYIFNVYGLLLEYDPDGTGTPGEQRIMDETAAEPEPKRIDIPRQLW